MGGSVLSRLNHYDVLGLAPSASEGEVARAFAARMSLFGTHAPGEAAQICAAYETLRNPAKRRDYDRSLGIGAKPERPRQWAFAVTQAAWPGAVGSAAARPAALRDPEPLARAEFQKEESPELERAAAIAASLRRLAEPAVLDASVDPKPEPQVESWPIPKPVPVAEMDVYRILDRRAELGRYRDDDQPFEWRRPALVVGGFIAAAGLVGAFAGLSVRDDAASAAAPAVTVPLPAAKQVAQTEPPMAAPVEMAAPAPAPVRVRPAATRSRFARAVESQTSETAAQAQSIELASAEAAPEPVEPRTVAASLPLPDTVVARTIERIGYSCGKVTGAVAGSSPGVYQVTCSSGQTYRATPVNGRYRFRRSGAH